VVLPEQIELPTEADDLLTRWVREGGVLIASGRVSPRIVEDIPTFALEEALGVRWTGHHEREGWLQHRGLPLRVPATVYRVAPQRAETLTSLLCSGHEGRQESLGYPAVTRSTLEEGDAFYIAADFFAAYHRGQYPALREVLEDIFSQALPRPPVSTTAPPTVELVARARPGEVIVHLVDHSPGKSLAQNSPFIEAVPTAQPVQVSIGLPEAPLEVRLQPGDTEPEWSYEDQRLTVAVPGFHIHTAVLVRIPVPEPDAAEASPQASAAAG
jgi:hypothetical protein